MTQVNAAHPHPIFGRTWVMQVEEAPSEVWRSIVLSDGCVYEDGNLVGSYAIISDVIEAFVSEHEKLQLTIAPMPTGALAGMIFMKLPDGSFGTDENMLCYPITLRAAETVTAERG